MPVEQQAIIHLAWRREAEEARRLVFGLIEVLPTCIPTIRGHPFRRHVAARKGPTLYVARFPLPAAEAAKWFEAAAAGDLCLPSHPDQTTPGDGQPIAEPFSSREPIDGSESTSETLPFIRGMTLARGLFGSPDPAIATDLATPATRQWLRGMLFFDLLLHPEYMGSLILARHHPDIRDLSSRLVVEQGGEHELIRIRRWPGALLSNYRLLAVEQRTLGLGKPREIAVASSLTRLDWNGKIDRTALALLHPEHGVCSWREPATFVRSIATNISFSFETRRVVQDVDADGTPTRYYDVPMSETPSSFATPSHAKQTAPVEPSTRAWRGESRRRQIRDGARLGLQWFNDGAAAEKAVQLIIGLAATSLTIVDAYFGALQLRDFGLAVRRREVLVKIVTSAEHLKTKMDPPHDMSMDLAMEQALTSIANTNWTAPEVRVMLGEHAELHDRFLIVDDRVWFSGNSLNKIGARASMLAEIPNPEEVLVHLEPVVSRAQLFSEWLAARRVSRARGAQPA